MRMLCGMVLAMLALDGAAALGLDISYTYDPAGNILTKTEVVGKTTTVTTYTYSATNRVLTESQNGRTWVFRYDRAGNRIEATDPDGVVTNFDWDAHDNLSGTDISAKPEALTYKHSSPAAR